jgi:hypothetical protein
MSWLFPALKRALLTRVVPCRMLVRALRARAAVALSHTQPEDSVRLLLSAEADAEKLVREREAWGRPSALAISGTVAMARKQHELACTHFAEAARGYDALSMSLYAAAARRLEGQLRGGDAGAELVREADARFHAQGVRNPERMTALLVGEPPA